MHNYKEIKCIGNGSFGQVFMVEHITEKKNYVIKKIKTAHISEKDKDNIENEVALLKQLHHPNIVAYKDSFTLDDCIHIVMSYCEGGDMYNRIKANENRHFPENVKKYF